MSSALGVVLPTFLLEAGDAYSNWVLNASADHDFGRRLRELLEMGVDGVRLDGFRPGTVRDVSPLLGAWLVAERYAEPEMRASVHNSPEDFSDVKSPATQVPESGPRRRSADSSTTGSSPARRLRL